MLLVVQCQTDRDRPQRRLEREPRVRHRHRIQNRGSYQSEAEPYGTITAGIARVFLLDA